MNKISTEELFKIAYNHLQNKNYTKSIELFNKILNHFPENLSVLRNLLHAYAFSGDYQNAENTIKKVIKLNEKEPYAYQFYASILKSQDKIDEMIEVINEGLGKKLMNSKWNYQKDLLFPFIPESKDQIEKFRNKIDSCYEKIINNGENLEYDNDQIIQTPHFELSYSNHENLNLNKKSIKAIRILYKDLNENHSVKNKILGKIKIAFISEYFTSHTIGKLFKELIFYLDKSKFEVYVCHSTKTKPSKIYQEFFEKEKKGFLKNIILPGPLKEKINLLKNMSFDVLFYPDIGMSIEMYYLSMVRLARFQIMSWGHPETTGSDSIDYFLCSKSLITNETNKYYSEKFLLTNYLPMIYQKPNILKRLENKEIAKKNIYSCPQTLYKFHPDFDDFLFEILKKDVRGVLYLIKDSNKIYFNKLIDRFKKNKKFDSDRIVFLDPLSNEDFINHLGSTSVLLDPIYFGSGNSFHESMVYGTPTVTMPNKFIKSRIVYAAYNQMEIENPPVVKNKNDYVELAVQVANDANLLQTKKYFQNKADKKLFNTFEAGKEFSSVILSLFN